MLNKLLERLTDNYNKHPDSNIGKLFSVIAKELEEVQQMLIDVKEYRDIDKAVGKLLDDIGKNVQEYRSTDNDELYRQLVKTKIIANLSQGDIETLNEVANVLLGDSFKGIVETWNKSIYNNEPAGLAITIKNYVKILPFKAIDRAVAGGVGLKWILELHKLGDIFIASMLLSGEEITVYPWNPTELFTQGKVYIATGISTELDTTTVYPKGVM